MSNYSKTLIAGTEASPLYRVLQSRIEGAREIKEQHIINDDGAVMAAVSIARPLDPLVIKGGRS